MITRLALGKMLKDNEKGMALMIVLGTLLVVVILANVILGIVSSQSRLTHHQISRIQAYYAAQAGINYALEKLRLGNDTTCWPATGTYSHIITRGPAASPCDLFDSSLPVSISYINITVGEVDANGTRPVNATVNYTYSPD